MPATGESRNALAAKPAAPMKLGSATCQKRSPVRSEWLPHQSIANDAAM